MFENLLHTLSRLRHRRRAELAEADAVTPAAARQDDGIVGLIYDEKR